MRAKELLDDIADYTRNIDVQVLEGNKVLEMRNSGINKGAAALEWLAESAPDFILSIGDDWTDEDVFRALPSTAYTVRVGVAKSAANFFLTSHTAVRWVLRELTAATPEQTEEFKAAPPHTRMAEAAGGIKTR